MKEAGGKVRITRNYLDEPEKSGRKGKEKDITPMDIDDERSEVVPLRLLKRSNEDQMNKLFKLLYLYQHAFFEVPPFPPSLTTMQI